MNLDALREKLLEMNALRTQRITLLPWEQEQRGGLYHQLETLRKEIEEAAPGFVVWYLEADATYALVPMPH